MFQTKKSESKFSQNKQKQKSNSDFHDLPNIKTTEEDLIDINRKNKYKMDLDDYDVYNKENINKS